LKKYWNIKTLLLYLRTYYISVAVFGYILLSTIVKSYTAIDLTIPCPIYYTTGIRCFGCGLTTAATYLFKLDFEMAWNANPIVFITVPLISFLVIRHWIRFAKENSTTNRE